jgi:DNA anti-recombination protein RmuC
MKGFGITLFMMISWIVFLTLAYCQLKDNYNTSQAEVERLHETVKVYKSEMEKFVETYSDRTSKELADYKNETEQSLLKYEQTYEATIKGIMGEWE